MIYLNNAATTFPKPPEVLEAVSRCLATIPCETSRGAIVANGEDVVEECRREVAQFFNATDPRNIIFTSGATESINLVLRGLDLRGKRVVTTAAEHNSVIRPLKELKRRGLLALTIVDCDRGGRVDPQQLAAAFTPDTALVVLTHCSNVTGNVNDLDTIVPLCRRAGVLVLLDAAQSAGAVPLDLQKYPIDMVAFAAHKSLYGIRGSGGLYLRSGLEIEPLKYGGTGTRSDFLFMPRDTPVRYEAGTPNIPGIAALQAGIAWIKRVGIDAIAQRCRRLEQQLLEHIAEIPQIILYGDLESKQRCPIVSLNVQGRSPEDVALMLGGSFGVITRSGLHCAPLVHHAIGAPAEGTVRLSLSFFTTEVEIEAVGAALRSICSSGRTR